MRVVVDDKAGFCFGVTNAIRHAETLLDQDGSLCSLGELVHNEHEVARLEEKGLEVVSRDQLRELKGNKLLFRAHGEPPATYALADLHQVQIIDATCPIVKHLQRTIRRLTESDAYAQVVVFGKKNHPEVVGLVGQDPGRILVAENELDVPALDKTRDVHLFAQTTVAPESYNQLAEAISDYLAQPDGTPTAQLFQHNTICRQVTDRIAHLKVFASAHDVLLFVSGKNSSNGRFLFGKCAEANSAAHLICEEGDIRMEWFKKASSVGITGATSTPLSQLNKIADYLRTTKE